MTEPGAVVWAVRHGGPGDELRVHAAADNEGRLMVALQYAETASFGGAPLTADVVGDVAVLAYGAGGEHRWSVSVGSGARIRVGGIATDANGDVFVAGDYEGASVFDEENSLTSAGKSDAFVAKFSGESGALVWVSSLGALGEDRAGAVAVDGDGGVYVAGAFSDTLVLGDSSIVSAGDTDVFVAKLTTDGAIEWGARFGSAGADLVTDATVDASGELIVVGAASGAIDFGGGVRGWTGGYDGFGFKLSGQGEHVWSAMWGGPGDDRAQVVRARADGAFVIGGEFVEATSFGGAPLMSLGGVDGFIASFSATGAYQWARVIGGSARERLLGMAIDDSGALYIAGGFYGSPDFGAGPASNAGNQDAFVAKYDSTGAYQWVFATGSPGNDDADAVLVAGAHVYGLLSFSDSISAGGETLVTAGGRDLGIVSLLP
ncbi:hypothetical protein [Haliangium sp.]|uniref:hypothetical protein n=1 Tax=Haliangium sp. TaxID=2663208 RepID=UPI003D0AD1D0